MPPLNGKVTVKAVRGNETDGGADVWDFHKQCGWWERDPAGTTNFNSEMLAATAHRLVARLEQHRIRTKRSSALGNAVWTATVALPESIRTHACPPGPCVHLAERVRLLQTAADVAVIERIVERAGSSLGTSGLGARLRDFAGGFHPTTKAGPRTNEGNRMFELVCAGWISRYATDVAIAEPDLQCSFQGASWGVTCKVTNAKLEQAGRLVRRRGADSALDCGRRHRGGADH